jgi:hypothetical protein
MEMVKLPTKAETTCLVTSAITAIQHRSHHVQSTTFLELAVSLTVAQVACVIDVRLSREYFQEGRSKTQRHDRR